jgi:hypothetical protein
MTLPTDNRERQTQAFMYLRGSLSRCEQEGCDFVDVIRIFYAWTQRQKKDKPKQVTFVRLTEDSPMPPIGSKVRIENETHPHIYHDIGIVMATGNKNTDSLRVYVRDEKNWEYYDLYELSLVVEG